MRASLICLVALVTLGGLFVLDARTEAALTPAQRRELRSLQSDVTRASVLVRRRDYEDAEKILSEVEQKIDAIAKEAMVTDKDVAIAGLNKSIALQRAQLAKAKGADAPAGGKLMPGAGVSLTKDVLPILQKNCGGCHGATGNARGNLRLDSFANMRTGGSKGPLLSVGNANQSLIVRRITGQGNQKMPPGNRPALSAEDVKTITEWINQGAKNDGNGPNAPKPNEMENVVIPKATGQETVSFTKDIAPFMVNLCLGCHSGNTPRGGLSLVSVNTMMRGGDSGRVIIPGNLEGSRLFRLVGGLENPRMPQNQARITRKNYEDLRKWFLEGNKFDVADPGKPLREIVPTEEEIAAERLAKLSPEEFVQHRLRRSHELWNNALSKQEYRWLETREFAVYGNASDPRLQEIANWAEEHAENLRKTFSEKSEPLWKGKLAIFVVRDRFDFEEFNSVNEGREAPREMYGFAKVTSTSDEAYVALQDVGDAASATEPGLRTSLIEHLTAAFLQRKSGQIPSWVSRGMGLYFAAQAETDSPYFEGLRDSVPSLLKTVTKPADVFADGTFSPSAVGAVGYTLVDFLIKKETAPTFGKFIRVLQSGGKAEDAIKTVYGPNLNLLAEQYGGSIKGGRGR